MTRWDWMLLKAYAPAALVAIGSFVVALNLKALAASPVLGGIAALAPWVALIGLATAVVMSVVPAVRFWRWERGDGPMCHRCGGPLGPEIHGRCGAYRRCLACNGNTSARYYP